MNEPYTYIFNTVIVREDPASQMPVEFHLTVEALILFGGFIQVRRVTQGEIVFRLTPDEDKEVTRRIRANIN